MKKFLSILFTIIMAAMFITSTLGGVQAAADFNFSAPFVSLVSIKTSAAANSTPKKMKATINANCSDYNHVGNEWSETFEINGSEVKSGDSVKLKAGDKITVSATVIEYDDGKSDVGSESTSKTLTQSDIDKGFQISMNVNVKENGGRYKGNVAKWTVTYNFS